MIWTIKPAEIADHKSRCSLKIFFPLQLRSPLKQCHPYRAAKLLLIPAGLSTDSTADRDSGSSLGKVAEPVLRRASHHEALLPTPGFVVGETILCLDCLDPWARGLSSKVTCA